MNNFRIPLLAALILVISFTAFYPCLKNGFVNFDDTAYVNELTAKGGLSVKNVKHIFTSFFLTHYQPLNRLTYFTEYTFFKLNPFIYHLTSLIIHLLNCLLVFWLIYLFSRNSFVSFATAVLFVLHPVHVESVAWISDRQDLLCAFFFLAAVISYCYYLKSEKTTQYYYVAFVLFILSLLSKVTAVTLPFVLIITDYLFGRKIKTKTILEKIPFILVSLFFAVLAVIGKYATGAIKSEAFFTLPEKMMVAVYGLVFYAKKIIFPVNLSCFYPYPGINNITVSFYSWVMLIALFAVVFVSLRYTKKIIFGVMFFLITIFPALQFVPINVTIVADRYLYLPAIGIFYIFACVLGWLYAKKRKNLKLFLLIILTIVICVLGFLTWQRCKVWNNSIALWSDVLKKYPRADLAYDSLGVAYAKRGEYDKAIANYNKAIELNPVVPVAYNNRAVAYAVKGEYDRAILDYDEAIKLNHFSAESYSNRGTVYAAKGEYGRAILDFTKAIKLKPTVADAYYNRGLTYAKNGVYDKAILDYTKAIELNPNFAEVYNNRAVAYFAIKEFEKALKDARAAQELGYNVGQKFFDQLKNMAESKK